MAPGKEAVPEVGRTRPRRSSIHLQVRRRSRCASAAEGVLVPRTPECRRNGGTEYPESTRQRSRSLPVLASLSGWFRHAG